MNILIAMDSFKGSLTSLETGNAVREAIINNYKDVNAEVFEVADGGEGLTEALLSMHEHDIRKIRVTGPVGEKVEVSYGIYNKAGKRCAVIEMAKAAGLTLVPEEKKNPLYTTTYGVGEMILDAINEGCKSFIIGIGGSATNDAGIGMLQALGFHFLRKDNSEALFGATALRDTVSISDEDVTDKLYDCEFRIVCDVKNPLYGDSGSSMVFAPQKGATLEQAKDLEAWMKRYADIVKKYYPKADASASGVGAAGGLGFAFQAFLGAKLERGIEVVLNENGFAKSVKEADLVITGEGKLDSQTAMGKVPVGVAEYAKKYGVKVIAFGGLVDKDSVEKLKACGIDECYQITPEGMDIREALKRDVAIGNLKEKVDNIINCDMEK